MTAPPSPESTRDSTQGLPPDSRPDSNAAQGATTELLRQFQGLGSQVTRKNVDVKAFMDSEGQSPAVPPSVKASKSKLSDEAELLASIPSNIGDGIAGSAKDTWQHIGRTTFETTSGLVLGAGFCLLSKNPNPFITAATTWAGRAFIGIAAVDLAVRFAKPMADTWAHPENLDQDKVALGTKLGDAVFNYSVAIAGGVGGASLGEKYLATTKLGTILQGFKETEISAQALGKLVSQPSSAEQPLSTMARAFSRRGVTPEASASARSASSDAAISATGSAAEQLPISGSIRLRHMPDGSQIGSTPDGSVMVVTKEGTGLWFKNDRSLFGLRNKLGLAKVLHLGGDETDVLTGMYSPTTLPKYGRGAGSGAPAAAPGAASGPHFYGKDPSDYFDALPTGASVEGLKGSIGNSGPVGSSLGGKGQTYTTRDGTRFVIGEGGVISAVESGGNRVFLDAKGKWKLGLQDFSVKPSDILGLDLNSASYNVAAIADRLDAAKKGAEVGLTEIMLERGGDIGSSLFEHEVLVRGAKTATDHAPE